ncbi:MAG: ABC transporter permease [Vicinamibacterales bacterium]
MPLVEDIRHGLRLLGHAPLFTATAVLSLALGVAASAAVYGVADALLAPAAGVRDAGRVVDIGRGNAGSGFDNMAYPAFDYLRRHTTTLAGLAAVEFGGRPMSLTVGGRSERVFGTLVSANFFDVLGTRAVLGRFFRADEDVVPGERPVVVLTHRFWTRRLNADPTVLDRPLRLNNREFAVVGVAEPGFEGVTLAGTDLWVPMAMVAEARGLDSAAQLTSARSVWHVAVGRLRDGVDRATAAAELNTLHAQYLAATPAANPRHTVAVVATSRVPGPMRTPFLVFIGALGALTAALLAIGCSNVAGMLLARASARRREMATRLALGASRGRLMAQLLTETVLLFLAAAALALPLTVAAVGLLNAALPAVPIAVNLTLAVNARVVGFAVAVSLATAVLFGLAPARHALGADVAPSLHGGAATPDRRRMALRHGLVVVQVALALMLVATAGVFVRTLRAAAAVDPGLSTAGVTLANLDLSLSGFRGPAAVDLVQRLQARVAALPGVEAVAGSRMIPLQGSRFGLGRIRVAGYAGPGGDDVVDADWNVVTPEYFDVVRMPLVAGRGFTPADTAGTGGVAVVNAHFARTVWPDREAVGQRFLHRGRDERETPIEVVGVVADARYRYISDAPEPFVFVPMAQHPVGDVTLFVRHGDRPGPDEALRGAVAQVEPSLPVMFVQSFDEAVAIGLTPQRLTAWIAGGVGIVGTTLAALGLYGLMAFLVALRTREIAIRMALGASAAVVQRQVLASAAGLAGAGAVLGLALAAAVATLLRALLVGVSAIDPPSWAAALGLSAVVLAAASWRPARRAATTDPARALRSE